MDWMVASIPQIESAFNILSKQILFITLFQRNWGSSVSTVSDCRLNDRASITPEAKDFYSSLCVQTSAEAHQDSYAMSIEGPFSGIKRGRGVTLTTDPHLVLMSKMSQHGE
jgi:hypothetical protein